jgi:spore maturation protein CgeB
LKILIPYPTEPDNFQDNVAFTLRMMGHQVVAAPKRIGRSRHGATRLLQDVKQKAFPRQWNAAERWVIAVARQAVPDIVLCLTQSLRDEVLDVLRKLGVRHLIAWWGDTPANMQEMGLLSPNWDRIFLKDVAAVAKFEAVRLQAELLHEAMNPAWHKRCFESIGHDIAVAGSLYGYRQYLVKQLASAGVPLAVYGASPPRWADPIVKSLHSGKYIVREEKSQIFGSALACLNPAALSEGDSLNCRAFEIAGACGLQLIEDKRAVSSCFEPNEEVLVYRSIEEIESHIAKAKRDIRWAMRIREAGYRRAHSDHTYARRLRHILHRIAE